MPRLSWIQNGAGCAARAGGGGIVAEFPAMPLWTDALIGDTYQLTPAEFGAYMRLMIVQWRSKDCSLPNDDVFLGRAIGDPKNWHRIKKSVLSFFTLGDDGRYRQMRVVDERNYTARQAEKSAAGGRAKALKSRHVKPAKSTPIVCLNDAPLSLPTPTKKRQRKPVAEPPEFIDFWNSVPRRHGRYEAVVAYNKAIELGADPSKVNAAAKRWRLAEEKTEEKYIALPATWLNKRRFEDYHAPPATETDLEYDEAKKEWRWKRGREPENPERAN